MRSSLNLNTNNNNTNNGTRYNIGLEDTTEGFNDRDTASHLPIDVH